MKNLELSLPESLILNKLLLLQVQELTTALKKQQCSAFDQSASASLLRRFLVEKHPELTTELSECVLQFVQEGGYDKPLAAAGLCALEYHIDVIKNSNLDAVCEELAQIKQE